MSRVLVGIKGLEYGDALVGLRIFLNGEIWDVDNETLRGIGLTHYDIRDKIKLKLVGDLLISSDEEMSGQNIMDITDNEEAKDFLRSVLFSEPWSGLLKGFQMPWKISLQEFMNDGSWVAVRVSRTDEYRNQHELIQPDGTKWCWGWIGSARSPELAKWNFHKEQVRYALHRGEDVADVALASYPEYIEVKRLIREVYSRITHDERYIYLKTGDGVKSFLISDYPRERYNERGFVTKMGLIPSDLQVTHQVGHWFDPREITCIAIGKYIRENI